MDPALWQQPEPRQWLYQLLNPQSHTGTPGLQFTWQHISDAFCFWGSSIIWWGSSWYFKREIEKTSKGLLPFSCPQIGSSSDHVLQTLPHQGVRACAAKSSPFGSQAPLWWWRVLFPFVPQVSPSPRAAPLSWDPLRWRLEQKGEGGRGQSVTEPFPRPVSVRGGVWDSAPSPTHLPSLCPVLPPCLPHRGVLSLPGWPLHRGHQSCWEDSRQWQVLAAQGPVHQPLLFSWQRPLWLPGRAEGLVTSPDLLQIWCPLLRFPPSCDLMRLRSEKPWNWQGLHFPEPTTCLLFQGVFFLCLPL